MLSASYRLRSHCDFDLVYRRGKNCQSDLFRIIVLKRPAQNHKTLNSRAGVVVANKIIKKAVERNKKKRQIRASLRELLTQAKEGYDIIVVAKAKIISASYRQILADLTTSFYKVHLLDK